MTSYSGFRSVAQQIQRYTKLIVKTEWYVFLGHEREDAQTSVVGHQRLTSAPQTHVDIFAAISVQVLQQIPYP